MGCDVDARITHDGQVVGGVGVRQRTGPVRPIAPGPPVRNPLLKLIPNPKPKPPGTDTSSGFRVVWATVTAAFPDPVQVQVDTETDPLPGVPSMLCTPSLGDRVLLLQVGRRVIVLGIAQPDQSRRTAWQSGAVTITPTAVNTPTTQHVDFTVEFSEIPSVQVTAWTSVPGNLSVSFTNPSTTGVDLVLVRTDAPTATSISWTATTKY